MNNYVLRLRALSGLLSLLLVTPAVFAQLAPDSVPEVAAERVFEIPADQRTGEAPVVTALALSHDGKLLATGGDDNVIRIWDRETGALKKVLQSHTDWVRVVEFDPTGRWLATAGDDRGIKLWNLTTYESVTLPGSESPTYCLCFRPDGKQLLEAGFEDKIRVFDVETRQFVRELEAPSNDVRAMSYSPSGDRLIAAGRNGHIRVWRDSDLTLLQQLDAHRQRVRALAFSPDGGQFASGGDDRQLVIWNSQTGAELFRLPLRPGKVQTLVYCGTGLMASGASDNVIRLWDLDQRRDVLRLVGHTGSISVLEYHAETGELISASYDTSVRIWKPMRDGKVKVARQPAEENATGSANPR